MEEKAGKWVQLSDNSKLECLAWGMAPKSEGIIFSANTSFLAI